MSTRPKLKRHPLSLPAPAKKPTALEQLAQCLTVETSADRFSWQEFRRALKKAKVRR